MLKPEEEVAHERFAQGQNAAQVYEEAMELLAASHNENLKLTVRDHLAELGEHMLHVSYAMGRLEREVTVEACVDEVVELPGFFDEVYVI